MASGAFISRAIPPSFSPNSVSIALTSASVEHALAHEPRRPHLARRRVRADRLVQLRLRERRLVGLVVTPAAIAHEVDQHVLRELVAIRHREPHRDEARFGIIGVHVHDRHLESLRRIARVARRPRVDRIGREAHLVVHDEVHRPADAISA